MAEYLIQSETLTAIADAVRSKIGSTEPIAVGDIATKIGDIDACEAIETAIDLDFSAGGMEVTPEEGKAFSKVTVQKPETLVAENIAEGVNIAGIIGALEVTAGGCVMNGGVITGEGTNVELEHGLGVVPDFFYIGTFYTLSVKGIVRCFRVSEKFKSTFDTGDYKYGESYVYWGSYNGQNSFNTPITDTASNYLGSANDKTIMLGNANMPLANGKTYFWFAVGGLT